MENETSLIKVEPQELSEFSSSYNDLIKFTKKQLKENTDYGIIPGTRKRSLYKAGAEKIAFLFGLKPELKLIKEVEDFEKGFFFYKYECKLIHFASGKSAGSAIRSCNSMEKKYIKQIQQYKDYSVVNTIDAMAQKRAIVSAVVQATMATEIFDNGDGDLDEAPGTSQPVTQDNSPSWYRAIKKLFGVADERGFTSEQIEGKVKATVKVESMKDVTANQLEEITELLITKYEVVSKGEKPRPLGVKVVEPKQEELKTEPEEPKIETPSIIYCYNTIKHGEKKVKAKEKYQYYCSEECQEEWKQELDRRYEAKRKEKLRKS